MVVSSKSLCGSAYSKPPFAAIINSINKAYVHSDNGLPTSLPIDIDSWK